MKQAYSKGLYPPPNSLKWTDGTLDVTNGVVVEATSDVPEIAFRWLSNTLRTSGCADVSVKRVHGEYGIAVRPIGGPERVTVFSNENIPDEGYRLHVSPDAAALNASSARGLVYGVDTLCRLIASSGGAIPACEIDDAPVMQIRGVHTFLPAREDLPFYLRMLEFLARYRYNTVYLETAGGMEFERHPEINRAWEEFAHELTVHPGGQKGLQESQWFDWKNDPHVDLAGGTWLTKDETRQIVDKARELNIEIVPEVQSLAHCYYLTTAHPEIAEAQDDPFPDSYCPSNPKSYELLFDVMDEIIEVFDPKTIHIGHDEAYTFRRCPLCRKRTAADIFADDVTKIHGYLASKGVETAMWCDKFLNIDHPNGEKYGGVLRRVYKGKQQWVMPPTHPSVEKVPRDMLLVDWYWMLDDKTPDLMADRGFKRLIYGNFSPTGFPEWPKFREHELVLGAEISTWVKASEDVLSRQNSLLHGFVEGACTLWSVDYDPNAQSDELRAIAQAEMTRERDVLGGRVSLMNTARSGDGGFVPVSLDAVVNEPFIAKDLPTGEQSFDGIPFDVPRIDGQPGAVSVRFVAPIVRIPVDESAEGFIALMGTSIDRKFRMRNDELYLGKDVVAKLRFHYGEEDSTDRDCVVHDLVYGETLFPWGKKPRSYWSDPVMTTYDADGKPVTLYAVEWVNPHPERKIRLVDFVWMGGRTMDGEICLLGLTRAL